MSPPRLQNPQLPKSRISVGDDDPDTGMALCDLFEKPGHEGYVGGNGSDAVDGVTHLHFDAVSLDAGLPDMGGLSVRRTLNERIPQLPFINLSAFTSLGEYATLAKPYKVQGLPAKVESALCCALGP